MCEFCECAKSCSSSRCQEINAEPRAVLIFFRLSQHPPKSGQSRYFLFFFSIVEGIKKQQRVTQTSPPHPPTNHHHHLMLFMSHRYTSNPGLMVCVIIPCVFVLSSATFPGQWTYGSLAGGYHYSDYWLRLMFQLSRVGVQRVTADLPEPAPSLDITRNGIL